MLPDFPGLYNTYDVIMPFRVLKKTKQMIKKEAQKPPRNASFNSMGNDFHPTYQILYHTCKTKGPSDSFFRQATYTYRPTMLFYFFELMKMTRPMRDVRSEKELTIILDKT